MDIVITKLMDLGVTKLDDCTFLKAEDLDGILPPIQSRRLITLVSLQIIPTKLDPAENRIYQYDGVYRAAECSL